MGKVDHADNAVDHGIAQCDKGIDRTLIEPVDNTLNK